MRRWESRCAGTDIKVDCGRTKRYLFVCKSTPEEVCFNPHMSKRAAARTSLWPEEEEELGVSSYSKSKEPLKQTAIPTLAELAALSKYNMSYDFSYIYSLKALNALCIYIFLPVLLPSVTELMDMHCTLVLFIL